MITVMLRWIGALSIHISQKRSPFFSPNGLLELETTRFKNLPIFEL